LLEEKNIRLGLSAKSRDDCIRKICAVMIENGYVGDDYADAVIERENDYPTGLPTEGVIIAIPHANKGTVHRPSIGAAILKSPVGFYNMVDPEELLMAEIVFVLANLDPEKQLQDLSKLMECFSDTELLKNIRNVKTVSEMIDLFKSADMN